MATETARKLNLDLNYDYASSHRFRGDERQRQRRGRCESEEPQVHPPPQSTSGADYVAKNGAPSAAAPKIFFRYELPISFQFHHTQMGGAHAGRFLANPQEEINRIYK